MGRKKITIDCLIDRFKSIHNEKYSYDGILYEGMHKKIPILCKKCNIYFRQTPTSHLSGGGCPMCARTLRGINQLCSTTDLIEKFMDVHGNVYGYSKVVNNGFNKKCIIECRKHGDFLQEPSVHLRGSNCPLCAEDTRSVDHLKPNDILIDEFLAIHGNQYDYSLTENSGHNKKVDIGCKIHGVFSQTPSAHLRGQGCPLCKKSKGEMVIKDVLISLNVFFEQQKQFDGCKNKRPLLFDFYIPSHNLIIEFDGEQHFRPIKHYGGDEGFRRVCINDSIKNKFCDTNNIRLVRISYKDVRNIDFIVKNAMSSECI